MSVSALAQDKKDKIPFMAKSLEKFEGKIDEHTIKGKLNGGGVPVTVDAGRGRIALDFK